MKGIILAGGAGSRLYPLTTVVTKQLQPVYDKPMIYYPLSLLMLGGIKEVLLISTTQDIPFFQRLLKDGSQLGIKIEYAVQEHPRGIPEAFLIGEDFIKGDDVALILGDNLLHGDMNFYRKAIKEQIAKENGLNARVFAYSVSDPERYGVVEFDKRSRKVLSIEEKPKAPKSSYAIPGLYLFDSTASERAKKLKPSPRGETEIVELIKSYLVDGKLGVSVIDRGIAWLDMGTPRSLLESGEYVGAIEERQGLKIACIEEVALRMGFLNEATFKKTMEMIPRSPYKDYLERILTEIQEKNGL
ncbi:MAG: glucose-1-phosphate thymidylyltransferase RfbA [Bacteriovoracaceae bacterium]